MMSIVSCNFPGSEIDEVPGDGKDLGRFRRNFTASKGSIVYFNEFHENETWTLRVRRLVE